VKCRLCGEEEDLSIIQVKQHTKTFNKTLLNLCTHCLLICFTDKGLDEIMIALRRPLRV